MAYPFMQLNHVLHDSKVKNLCLGDKIISDFHCRVNEVFVLLGSYTAWVGSRLQTFRDNPSVPYPTDVA